MVSFDAQPTRPSGVASARSHPRGNLGAPLQAGQKSPFPDLVGTVIADRYEVLEPLAQGGMGAIFRVRHATLGRQLALKVLRPIYARRTGIIRRFELEAQVASQLQHPHIIDIIDFGHTHDGIAYLAMELLEGEDLLATVRREGPLPWARLAPMALQICDALHAAHQAGVIHRDLKPANCYRTSHAGNPDHIKLLDFGVAKLLYGDEENGPITSAGQLVGTPLYIPPEAVDGTSPNPKFDVYALGVSLYQLLSGKRPYADKVSMELLRARALTDPMPIRQVAPHLRIPMPAQDVVMRALARDPNQRFPTAKAVYEAIEQSMASQATVIGVQSHKVLSTGRPRIQTPLPTPVSDASSSARSSSSQRRWVSPASSSGHHRAELTSGSNPLLESSGNRIATVSPPTRDQSPTSQGHRRAIIIGALIALACVSAVLLALALYMRM